MIDIHCHILPGIDDGPSTIEESIEMARIAYRDGITKIVATPHVRDGRHQEGLIAEKVNLLNSHLSDENIPVEILQGADVSAQMDSGQLSDYTINQTKYILIEFPHMFVPKNAWNLLFRMRTGGYYPIITHPERNLSVISHPELLFEMLETGTFVQVTAESLTGSFGIDIQQCACHLLKKGVVTFLATDAHSSTHRPPVLSYGLRVAEKKIGREKAVALVTKNPEKVLRGIPLHD